MLSRVADSLYWLSRYLERAEHTARMLDVHLNLGLDQSQGMSVRENRERLMMSMWQTAAGSNNVLDDDYRLTDYLTFDTNNPKSIVMVIAAARENARQVREQISSEMWMQINRLYLDMKCATMPEIWEHQPHEFFRMVREGSHLFQGITDATMNRDEGWQFIQLGRYIERAASIARLLDVNFNALLIDNEAGGTYLQRIGLLKSVTSFEAYCKVYHADMQPNWIVEFLLFNADFPHTIRFCIKQVCQALEDIAVKSGRGTNNRLQRVAGRLQSSLSFDLVDDVLSGDLHRYLFDIQHQCDLIHMALYETYITYTIEASA